jgi:hypothetical protein
MTTEITDSDIRALRAEAERAGDLEQAALCALALGGREGLQWGEPGTEWRLLYDRGTSQAEARAECERVIREARAQD